MSNEQKINTWFAQFEHRMHTDVPRIVAETATEYYQERFMQKNWDGKAWPKYNPADKPNRKEPSRGSLMMRSPGGLFYTIRPGEVTQQRVTIMAGNSRVRYARIHNEGGRVRALQYVRPHTVNNFMGKGKRQQIQAFSRRVDYIMPRRQFMGHSPTLNERLKTRLRARFIK